MSENDNQALAFLYASGQLGGKDANEFERRLADDQSARDALCTAVRLNWTMNGYEDPMPDPGYRRRVRERLQAKVDPNAGQRRIRLHPSLWALCGAAAAAVLLLVVRMAPQADDLSSTPPAALADDLASRQPADDSHADDGDLWPDLIGGHHLAQAVEETRRRGRAEEHGTFRMEDRASRLRAAPVYRQ